MYIVCWGGRTYEGKDDFLSRLDSTAGKKSIHSPCRIGCPIEFDPRSLAVTYDGMEVRIVGVDLGDEVPAYPQKIRRDITLRWGVSYPAPFLIS